MSSRRKANAIIEEYRKTQPGTTEALSADDNLSDTELGLYRMAMFSGGMDAAARREAAKLRNRGVDVDNLAASVGLDIPEDD